MRRTKSPIVLRQISLAFRRLASMSARNEKPSDPVEASKWLVAQEAVKLHVHPGQIIGVGTGSTAKYLVDHMAESYKNGALKDIVCIPSSFQARQLIIDGGLPISDLERYPELDICIDGADEVDPQLRCIKGGGGCLTQEKIVQSCAKRFVIIGDHRKASDYLGKFYQHLPVEVIPFAYNPVRRQIKRLLGGEVSLRMASKKAGPVITDNGNYILDWNFPKASPAPDWADIHLKIKMIPGVVETGLFVGVADAALFGQLDGSILTWTRPQNGLHH